MYIKQLEVDNFKSFANKVDIPLLKGFTTISGPNGSGKSTIIDSILFALGLSTSRALRAEKLFHLISTYNKRNEAYVKVTFGESEEGDFSDRKKDIIIPQKNKEVSHLNNRSSKKGIITRTANKSRIRPRRNAPEPMKVLY